MSDAPKDSFLSSETEKKLADFEAKLKAEQAAMPDTSIRTTGGIGTGEQFYFDGDEQIPIYDTGLNKQIDRVDMKVSKMRRMRNNTQVSDEVDHYMRQIRAEREAEANGTSLADSNQNKTAPFLYVVPVILILFGIIVIVAMTAM